MLIEHVLPKNLEHRVSPVSHARDRSKVFRHLRAVVILILERIVHQPGAARGRVVLSPHQVLNLHFVIRRAGHHVIHLPKVPDVGVPKSGLKSHSRSVRPQRNRSVKAHFQSEKNSRD